MDGVVVGVVMVVENVEDIINNCVEMMTWNEVLKRRVESSDYTELQVLKQFARANPSQNPVRSSQPFKFA